MDEYIQKYTADKLKICSFEHWILFLHPNQFPYIGRCYAWAKREGANELMDMNMEEREELFETILPTWNKANQKLFQHNLTNFAIFANTAKHLHAHFIPRYNQSRTFQNIVFTDPNPTGNYSPYPKKELPEEIFDMILSKIKQNIIKVSDSAS
jgi:diadenosine tetraphosphate (Ap4A) HIT family hydrolase